MPLQLLLVDDDLDEHLIFSMALEQVDPSVQCHKAQHGVEATQYLLSGQPLPDLIFLDVNMPLMNGLEFMNWRRDQSQFHHIPVYIYTTAGNPVTEAMMMHLGATQFLTKPYKVEEIVKLLQPILASFAVKGE